MKGRFERGTQQANYNPVIQRHRRHQRRCPFIMVRAWSEMPEKAYAIITLDEREKGKGDAYALENP